MISSRAITQSNLLIRTTDSTPWCGFWLQMVLVHKEIYNALEVEQLTVQLGSLEQV